MPITVSVREAKTYLSRLLNHVGMGEEVIIAMAATDAEAELLFPKGWKAPKPYLRITPQPDR